MQALISIIDDDEAVRVALQRILLAHGFAATSFASAHQFLASDQLRHACCLIVDVRMPGMSGLGLYQHLVAAGCRIPTILITGCPIAADRDAALAAGVVSYLAKPFSEQALLDDVALALDRPARRGGTIDCESETQTNGC